MDRNDERDAARYRYLRSEACRACPQPLIALLTSQDRDGEFLPLYGDDADAAIDAAIAGSNQ